MKQNLQTQHPKASQCMRVIIFTLFFLSFFATISWSQVAGDFRSVVSGNWNNSASWERFTGTVWQGSGIGANNPGQIPTILSSVFIQSGHTISLDAAASCNSITINGGAIVNASTFPLNVFTDWNNNGTFIAGTSTVNMVGDNQLIGGSAITSFNHLIVATTVTAALTSAINVSGDLSTTSTGTLKTETFNITVNGLTTAGGASSIKDAGAGIKQYNGGIAINGGSFVSTVPISIPSTGQLTVILGNLTLNAGTGTFSVAAGAPINISGGNITIGAAQTFSLNSTVNMTGGSINGNGALVINSTFNMNGGTLAGAGASTVSSPNVMNIAGTSIILSRSITAPTVNWQSGDITIGTGSILSATSVNVTSSGTISGNGTLAVSGVGASFVKSNNVVSTINSVLSLSSPASMSLSAGTLALGGGAIFTGPILVSNNATLQFNTGAYALNSPATITGTGSLLVNGGAVTSNIAIGLDNASAINISAGTLTLNSASTLLPPVSLSAGTLAVPTATTFMGILTISGGTMTTTAPVAIASTSAFVFQGGVLNINAGSGTFNVSSGTTANISGGTINVALSQTLNLSANTNLSAGVITGAGALTSNSIFNMSGGTLSVTGTATFSSPGILNINGSIALSSTLIATTTLNWTAGDIAMTGAGAINISNGVTATFSSSGSITSGGGGGGGGGGGTPTVSVSGAGTLLQKTGTATTTINTVCNISSPATMSINNGILALGGGGTMTGALPLSASTTIRFNAGTFTFSTPASMTGTGNVIVNGATVNANVAIALETTSNLTVTTGTFNLGATSTFNPSVNLNGGTFLMSAATTIANTVVINGGTMTSTAAVTFGSASSLTLQTGTINVNSGSTNFNVPSAVTTTINGGTISIASGQSMNLAGPVNMSAGAVNGVGSLNSSNVFNMSGGSMSGNGVTTISSPGLMNVSGTISIARNLNTTSLNWTAGNISVTSGAINASGAFNASSTGSVTGSGSISAASLLKTVAVTTTSSSQLIIGSGGATVAAGTFVFGQNSSIAGNLTIALNAKVQITNGKIVTAQTLTLGGNGAVAGSWGSNSSSATTKNDTYFVLGTTGVVSVATNTCVVPVASISSSTTVLTCATNSITLNANGTGFYSWDNASTSSTRTINSVGTYSLTVSSNGCGTSNTSIIITIDTTTPNVSAIAGSFTKTCSLNAAGNSIGEINVTGYTYAWSPSNGLSNASIASPFANPTETTTYIVTKTKTSSGCTATASVTVNVNTSTPIVNAGAPFTKTCISNVTGASIGETNDATAIYAWSPSTGLSSTTSSNPIANPLSTTSYTVTKTNIENGCTSSANVIATVNTTIPTVSAGLPFTKTCISNVNGVTIGETNNTVFNYAWSPSTGLSSSSISNPIANPLSTTTYTLTKTNNVNGCSNSATVAVTVNTTSPTVSAGNGFTKTCVSNSNGAAIGETNDASATYSWSPVEGLSSSTISNPIANPSVTTTYTVTKTNIANGCSSSASVTINVNTIIPIVSAGAPFTKTCISNVGGSTIGEINDVTATYAWSPSTGLSSTTSSNPIANPLSTTSYTVTKTNIENGCTSSANVTIQVNNTNPVVSAGNPFTKTCVLNATGSTIGEANDISATYAWSPVEGLSSSVISNPMANPSTNTTYTVTKTSVSNGCSSSANVTVTVNTTAPVTSINASSSSICNGSSAILTASGADNYVWSFLNQTSTIITVSPSATTTYSVTGTSTVNGCTNISSSSIIVNTLPIVSSSSASTTICEGSSTTISSTGADTYSWLPGNLNSNSIAVSPTSTTTYTVTGTNTSTGCSNTATQLITVNPLPSVGINATSVSICNGNSTSMTATGASTYAWQPNTASTSIVSVTPLATTTYTVTGTSSFGCVNTATKLITVNNCNLTLNLKLFIEGYYSGGGLMAPVRANQGIGNSTVNVDFITIELHNPVSPFATVASSIVFLKTNGTATATFTNVIPSSYYIVIKHRNAIKTWSGQPITTSLVTNYDFTTASNKAYGDNMMEVEPGIWAFYSGDISADDNIDLLDLTVLENDINEFAFGFIETDINGDGNVDLLDSPIVENNLNQFIFSNHP